MITVIVTGNVYQTGRRAVEQPRSRRPQTQETRMTDNARSVHRAIGLLMQLQHCTELDAHATLAVLSASPSRITANDATATPAAYDHSPRQTPSLMHAEWRLGARCRGLPTDIFFPPSDEPRASRRDREDAAKALCGTCPVLAQCRRYALDSAEPHGIWGATTPEERAARRSR